MNERSLPAHKVDDEFVYVATDEELGAYLEEIVPYIGWIVVYFNSLEDGISHFIREAILRDPIQDERLDVFLAEMLFAGKCRALMHLYGQRIEAGEVSCGHKELNELENLLAECAKRRNEYAHADWIGLKEGNYAKVKSQSKKIGLFHRYKRFEPNQMAADVELIRNARDALEEFNDKLMNHPR